MKTKTEWKLIYSKELGGKGRVAWCRHDFFLDILLKNGEIAHLYFNLN
jgi:hypothetical protein